MKLIRVRSRLTSVINFSSGCCITKLKNETLLQRNTYHASFTPSTCLPCAMHVFVTSSDDGPIFSPIHVAWTSNLPLAWQTSISYAPQLTSRSHPTDENGDPESGGSGSATALVEKGPPTSVIVPIYRRDCHQEVYAGTHQYPGPGVYLLKFDNTYSLWRSKTLYYRVYYTK